MFSRLAIATAALAISAVNAQNATSAAPATTAAAATTEVRICYHDDDYSEATTELTKTLSDAMPQYTFTLVLSTSEADALERLAAGECDFMEADMGSIQDIEDTLQTIAVVQNEDKRTHYVTIAVVLDDPSTDNIQYLADTKGLRSCHTGYSRTAGMQMPLGYGARTGVIPSVNNNHVETVLGYFTGGSCAYDDVDRRICQNCMIGDECDASYSDYDGSLRCLLDGLGDVAFLKDSTFPDNCGDNAVTKADWCGTKQVRQIEVFANSPTHVIVSSKTMDPTMLADLQAGFLTINTPYISGTHGYQYETLEQHQIVSQNYLDNQDCYPGSSTGRACVTGRRGTTEDPLVMATVNYNAEADAALSAYFSPIVVKTIPVESEAEGVSRVLDGTASFTDSDSGSSVAHLDDLESVAVAKSADAGTASYNAQAWVLRSSGIRSFVETKGKRSCHTGYEKSAGMYMPTGWATGRRLMTALDTLTDTVTEYWSKSCALPEIDTACPGETYENYGNYEGALRCLSEGLGDVAFIKDTTYADSCTGTTAASWCHELTDYEIIAEFGASPTHAIVRTQATTGILSTLIPTLTTKFAAMESGPVMAYFDQDYGFTDTETLEAHFGNYKETVACMPEANTFVGTSAPDCTMMEPKDGSATLPVRMAYAGDASNADLLRTTLAEISGLNIVVSVVDSEETANQQVMNRDADFSYVDAATTLSGLNYGLDTIAVELLTRNGLPYYNAGALVKASSGITTYAETERKRSCHTGFSKSAGMYMPVGYGVRNMIINEKDTLQDTVSEFWSAGQCAAPVLCSICDSLNSADGWANNAECPANEMNYSDYDGALECMLRGAGDVAFIRTTTFDEVCGVTGAPDWCVPASEVLLIQDFGQVPSHPMVYRQGDITSGAQSALTNAVVSQGADSKLAEILGTGGFQARSLSEHTEEYRNNVGCVPGIADEISTTGCVKTSSASSSGTSQADSEVTSAGSTDSGDSDSAEDLAIAALCIAILALILAPVVAYFVARKMYVRWASRAVGQHRKFSDMDPESVTNVNTNAAINESGIPERTV
ncbi:hypothetical protein SARC_07783 [Sphaeroforma arctica JP610]|uniref:Transferrin-like domain-containing protein n=1 Tax=Sphaeroforma arctica JP610 TaxID=667725 RepID=A0A0L0FSS4_9EUKA|nr:hypothetical protein SARC_07783 [Sphaeroforma arctica JP610]KNC79835.1 hypothetical protein SARC_07783 [Sphaeroforma arctica JP610]|eukprot:XP_014153737.1 hypothetical protein SARC_07783 [Sphaeroforma arctica JP610]